MATRPARLVVLDRDGVINADSGEFIKSVAEWRPLPGSLEAIAALHRSGFAVTVVTNQSGVGRGLFSAGVLADIHSHMQAAIEHAGGRLAAIYHCPHRPDDGCECRKPRAGMLRVLERDFGCALKDVPMIGDRRSDLDAAAAVGARGMLVRTGTGRVTERDLGAQAIEVYDDLLAAARVIVAELAA